MPLQTLTKPRSKMTSQKPYEGDRCPGLNESKRGQPPSYTNHGLICKNCTGGL